MGNLKRISSLLLCFVMLLFFAMPGHAEIKRGSKGDDVIALQERLVELGYLNDAADGIFGANTEKALVAFQEANGLEPTGVATIKDINVLFSDDAKGISSAIFTEGSSRDLKASIDISSIEESGILSNPSQDFLLTRLALAPNVAVIAAVTEDNDPNGNLGKKGGYTSQIFFSSPLVSGNYAADKTEYEVIDDGTECGGSIEVYSTVEDAIRRDTYLGAFDGTAFASGSHIVVGTIIIRTSSELTSTEQEDFTEEILVALSDGVLDDSEELDDNVDATIDAANLPMLSVVESGFCVDDGYLYYAVRIRNNSQDMAVEYPEVKITARDKEGAVLSVDTQTMMVIYPCQELVWAGMGSEEESIPASIDVEIIKPEDYNIVNTTRLSQSKYIPIEIKSSRIKDNGHYGSLVGEVHNPNDYDIESYAIIIVFRNEDGNLVGGDCGFADNIPSEGNSAFEISINTDILTNDYEVYAMPW